MLPSSPVASGLLLLTFWLIYGAASAACLHVLRRRSTFGVVIGAAIVFSVIDAVLPLSFQVPSHSLIVAELMFFFGILRPAKLILFAFNRGPLGRDISLRQHLILANLPVMPLKCLPESIQKRMHVYQNSVARSLEIVASLVVLLLACAARCSLDADKMPAVARYATQLCAFLSFMNQLLNLPAAIATALGSEPVVTPFNEFWKAASVGEWWNYRWNNVVSLTLRLSVYQPIVDSYKATHPGRRTPGILIAVAGVATFALSGGIHVYAMVAQRFSHATLPLMSFFLAQAPLIGIQPHLATAVMQALRLISRPTDEKARRHTVNRVLTAVLIGSTVLSMWCRAYEPPFSDASEDLAQAFLRAVGLCDKVAHCQSL